MASFGGWDLVGSRPRTKGRNAPLPSWTPHPCWCEKQTVLLPPAWVGKRTATCGRPGCKPTADFWKARRDRAVC